MRILMIEDDVKLCEAVCFHLQKEGYDVDVCHDGEEGMDYAMERAHSLIILDRMLPSINGMTLLSRIRNAGIQTPVIITTALNGIGDRVQGLDSGADDYLVKPFAIEELIARIRALSRRPAGLENSSDMRYADISLDALLHTLTGPFGTCSLSNREAQLMEVLMRAKGRTMPRESIFAQVWGPYAPVEDGNLDNYIHFLRRRLKSVGSTLSIKTARGVGYSLEDTHA